MWFAAHPRVLLPVLVSIVSTAAAFLVGSESKPAKKTGLKNLQLITGNRAVVPGASFFAGLYLQHEPGYHTYWKAPGIVGVATSIEWKLPKGFTASQLIWPLPEKTMMADYLAYGYERDVCLVTSISAPKNLEAGTVTLRARIGLMCCARTCHPAWHDFEITLPVAKDGKARPDSKWRPLLEKTLAAQPLPCPKTWKTRAELSSDSVLLEIQSETAPFVPNESIYSYCETNLIHSDQRQSIEFSSDRRRVTFQLPLSPIVPENIDHFSALLYHPEGWTAEGTEGRKTKGRWVRVSVPISHRNPKKD